MVLGFEKHGKILVTVRYYKAVSDDGHAETA